MHDLKVDGNVVYAQQFISFNWFQWKNTRNEIQECRVDKKTHVCHEKESCIEIAWTNWWCWIVTALQNKKMSTMSTSHANPYQRNDLGQVQIGNCFFLSIFFFFSIFFSLTKDDWSSKKRSYQYFKNGKQCKMIGSILVESEFSYPYNTHLASNINGCNR